MIRLYALALSVLLTTTISVRAYDPQDDVEFKPGKFARKDGQFSMHYGITNVTGSSISIALVECAALNKDGEVIATSSDSAIHIRPSETAYGEVTFIGSDDVPKDADFQCRVASVSH